MSEDALAGKAAFCIPRRAFVALVAAMWFLANVGDVFAIMIWYPLTPATPARACTTHNCLKVFTCHGMQETTQHIREPALLLGGLIFGLFGLHGAVGINHVHLKWFAYFQLFIVVMYLFLLAFDGLFVHVCGGYPSNVIHQTLLSSIPDWPVMEDKKEALRDMDMYPVRLVNWMVERNVWRWNVLLSVLYAVVAYYCSHVTMILSRIYIDGPIGLGVNYRLGAWRAEVLLKHRIEEMEEELLFGKSAMEDSGMNDAIKENNKIEHLQAERGRSYGAV